MGAGVGGSRRGVGWGGVGWGVWCVWWGGQQQRRSAAPNAGGGSGSGASLTDADVAVGPLQQLVHALGAERGAKDARHRLGRLDVALHRVEALHPRLLLLLLHASSSGGEGQRRRQCQAQCGPPGARNQAPRPSHPAGRLPTLMMMKGRPNSSKASDMMACSAGVSAAQIKREAGTVGVGWAVGGG